MENIQSLLPPEVLRTGRKVKQIATAKITPLIIGYVVLPAFVIFCAIVF